MSKVVKFCIVFISMLGALFDLNDELNETLAAFRYQIENHNSIISTQFKLDKYEKVFDISDSYQMVKEGRPTCVYIYVYIIYVHVY